MENRVASLYRQLPNQARIFVKGHEESPPNDFIEDA